MKERGYMPPAKTVEWGTPQETFDMLNEEFNFTLDPCASHLNHKCTKYYTIEEDGLSMSWAGECVFMNPPYGNDAAKWIAKAYFESQYAEIIVALLPARTDTRWFHDYVYHKSEIRFIKGRLKFVGPDGTTGTATFPSMIIVWRNGRPVRKAAAVRTARANGYLAEGLSK